MLGALRDKIDQVPFHPFVVRASSGQACTVHNPGLIVLMKTKMFIAEPNSDRSATIPYLHVAGIEDSANGHAKRSSRGPRRG